MRVIHESFDIRTITLFVDDPEAWIVPWVERLRRAIESDYHVAVEHEASRLLPADVCFLLGCTRILPPKLLGLHRLNLVVHESALPAGRGFSPVAWQVLAGVNEIPVTLFAATDSPDAGPIYFRDAIRLSGTELLQEIRAMQGEKTVELVIRFLNFWPNVTPVPQDGEPTYFRRRTRADDEIAVNKSIAENFDHLRIVDNHRYPAWFRFRGRSYILRVEPAHDGAASPDSAGSHTPEDEA